MGKKFFILGAILIFSLILRVYKINSLPMYGDELTLAYDSYSILKTGKDQTGHFLPITFPMRGRTPGGYVYFSLPAVFLFGPTSLGVRALSLFSGLGIILLCYFLGKRIFNEKVGLLASFIAAISPWEIYLSRGGFETHFALFLALLGVTAFLYAKGKNWLYLIWAVSWGLAIHTYPTFKLTLPLLFLILLWYQSGFRNFIKNKLFITSVLILALFGAISLKETFFSNSEERFLSINIFANKDLKESIIQRVNSERTISTFPDPLKPIFINKQIEYARILSENYIKNLSPNFLYLRGDGNPRHNPGEMGMLYLVEFPLLFVAIINLWKENKKNFGLLIFWILIVPLATMLFDETHGLRNAFMLPPFILLASYALTKIERRFLGVAFFLILTQCVYILARIYFIAPAKFASFWSSDAKKASFLAMEKKNKYESIYLSKSIDNIEYAYPVYAKIDPNDVIAQYGREVKEFGNVKIIDIKDIDPKSVNKNTLVISK